MAKYRSLQMGDSEDIFVYSCIPPNCPHAHRRKIKVDLNIVFRKNIFKRMIFVEISTTAANVPNGFSNPQLYAFEHNRHRNMLSVMNNSGISTPCSSKFKEVIFTLVSVFISFHSYSRAREENTSE